MVFSPESPVKQVSCTRRKPHLMHQEFLDYHFQKHGALADEPDEPDLKPTRYTQTHIFDAAFGARPNGPTNANHPWVGRDDVTELFYRDATHLQVCMTSQFVAEQVGPDAVFFADFETAISLMAHEKLLEVPVPEEAKASDEWELAALLFLSPRDNNPDGDGVEMIVSPQLLSLLRRYAGSRIRSAAVNVGVEIPGLDPREYFGGKGMPIFSLVYKIHLTGGRDAVPMMRKIEAALQETTSEKIDWSSSFTVFGYEAVVLDQEKGIPFDYQRQPRLW
ncbi:hypothetical protein CFD26_105404 [Aspergillus turcosus]|uniref:EthD domain-containing protein n=1 Tax=Aspergillus turcosus TaxID=1245748 RepID=A0A3R7IHP1_9EURO|nr:hypothetical protein CFD26_105404 [Aspergillus turcosus]